MSIQELKENIEELDKLTRKKYEELVSLHVNEKLKAVLNKYGNAKFQACNGDWWLKGFKPIDNKWAGEMSICGCLWDRSIDRYYVPVGYDDLFEVAEILNTELRYNNFIFEYINEDEVNKDD